MVMKTDSIPAEAEEVKVKTHEMRRDAEGKGYLYRFDKEEKPIEDESPKLKSKRKKSRG